ncbi:hypothetical protein Trydic_g18915 [Trypoxylus dichotomus]
MCIFERRGEPRAARQHGSSRLNDSQVDRAGRGAVRRTKKNTQSNNAETQATRLEVHVTMATCRVGSLPYWKP